MDKYIQLNQKNLSQIAATVSCPTYDRSKVSAGIVHIGIGGFHRAHQAYYADELLEKGGLPNWGICGVALLPFDDKIYQVLKSQDGLYTVMIKELNGSLSIKVIGSIVEYIFAPNNPLAVIKKMADPETRIISLTITEGGYNYDEATGEFIFENPNIQHDLTHPDAPKTIFGYLAQAFKLRKKEGIKGCTVQSCDNIQGNGDIAKKMVISYIKRAEPDLVEWVNFNISFPNSMVDRITPVTTIDDIKLLKDKTGIQDDWPVVCEPFKQWVIEDDFISERPAWEDVGVKFVEDVTPYEKMKLSLLNAGHSVLGVLGALMGYNTIDEAISNPAMNVFLRSFMDTEVTPVLLGLEGTNLRSYKDSLIKRFGNIYMKDQIDRICSESSAKIPIFILPTIQAQLRENGSIKYAAFLIAAWSIYSLGVDEKGKQLNINDAIKGELNKTAIASVNNPKLFLEIDNVFGNLKASKLFVKHYTNAYRNISKYGVEKCLIYINNKVQTND